MPLDRDKFIAAAKAAGYTDKEIEAEVGSSSAAVAPPSSADQATAKNDAEFAAGKEKMKADYDEKNKANNMAGMSDVKFGDFETQIPTFFTTAPGMVTAGAALYGAGVGVKKAGESGIEGLKKVYGSLRDFSKEKFGDDGLLANQKADDAVKQAQMTSKEVSATQTPKTGTAIETEVGKKLQEIPLVEKSAKTTALKAAEKNIAIAEAPPEGWRANYLKNKSNPIGPGGFNYLAGQYGPEKAKAIWEEQYGKKNVPYEKVIQDWSASKNPAIPLAEGVKPGGTVPRGPHVPDYIKGGASIEGMTRTGFAALGLLPVAKELSKGNYKNALNEAIPAMSMVAPALSLAASPLYTSSEEKDTLNSIKQRGFKSFKELEEYKDKIAGGRGVAPPSNYQK